MAAFIAVSAAGGPPETTGVRNVVFQRPSGAEVTWVVPETVGVAPTMVAVAEGADEPTGVPVGAPVEGATAGVCEVGGRVMMIVRGVA
jgi:hypothetical protein